MAIRVCYCFWGIFFFSLSNGAFMSYSFTEKKRIRKSFAKRPSVLEVPSLLETQLHSYHEFLQADVPAAERRDEGLQGAFKSIFLSSATTV